MELLFSGDGCIGCQQNGWDITLIDGICIALYDDMTDWLGEVHLAYLYIYRAGGSSGYMV
jgi:hypothetical protein